MFTLYNDIMSIESSKKTNNHSGKYARTFENLLYGQLEEDSEVYASIHIGEDKIPVLAENPNVDRVVMFEDQRPLANLEEYFSEYKDIEFEDPSTYSGPVDAEFVSPPGSQAERNMVPEESQELLYKWAEMSDNMVDSTGKTIFLDYSWDQAIRGGARSEELTMDKIHKQTADALSPHFEETKRVYGEDFEGILASREASWIQRNILDNLN